jgi:hypothetical protein
MNTHVLRGCRVVAQSGSVSSDPDCRARDLKAEFNRRINASSAVAFVIGDKTTSRMAGNACRREHKGQHECYRTPYKQDTNWRKPCKAWSTASPGADVGSINPYSCLEHEFMQAEARGKGIVVAM